MKKKETHTPAMTSPNPASESAPGRMARLRYLGQGPRTVHTPIPHLAKCEIEGTYTFSPDGDIPAEWAEILLELAPDLWVKLDANGQPVRPAVPAQPVAREAEPETRARTYVNRGLAVLARNRYFPGCTVVQDPNGTFTVVEAAKPPITREEDEYTDAERAEFAADANPGA